MESIAENLKRYRKAKKWTQAKVAKRIHVDRTTYTRYESGRILPSLDTCIRLCLALDITPNALMGWGDSEEPAVPSPEECKAAAQPFPTGLSEEEIDDVGRKIKKLFLETGCDEK